MLIAGDMNKANRNGLQYGKNKKLHFSRSALEEKELTDTLYGQAT